jgi:hypothetical protein
MKSKKQLPELLQESQVGPLLDFLPLEILGKILDLLPPVLDYYLPSKRFYELVFILHKKVYISRIYHRIGLERILQVQHLEISWGRVCLIALACLYQNEWSLGAPRLFYIKDNGSDDLSTIQKVQSKHPNPKAPEWRSIIECSMDISSFFEEDQDTFGMLLRYSERMDIGTFLLYLKLPSGPQLFRCKPIGFQTESEPPCGKLVMWDAQMFGTCSYCQKRLTRLQVCADCRVSQYCSRTCQQKDWQVHKPTCKELAFIPMIPPTIDF